jgi:hypothetical protein
MHPSAYIVDAPQDGTFPLVADGVAAPLVVSGGDFPGVVRVVGDLRDDLRRVTGVAPGVSTDDIPFRPYVVLIGTIGRSPLIDRLVAAGQLDVTGVVGRWETSLQQVVDDPAPGVRRTLVIAGSDQRGTIFAVYDVSRRIGVSPWHFWDDVPVPHRDSLHVLPGRHSQGTPAVRYRGFFINDENPNLGTWGPAFFGPGKAPGYPNGFNAGLYAKVFETLLRLKGNYLWPAVWGRAFAEDDPANHATATAYGVVIGTSHEAPMMRGIEEWNRHPVGEWSYRRNAEAIRAYWTEGIRRMVDEDIEGVVTLGMRGNGDLELADGDGIDLMEEIIATQRGILADVTGRDVTAIPQLWALYKEVQRYWDRGMRAPDDVTLVFTDDNWGNLMKLPDPGLPRRAGGYGMYYHFDYVGDGRNYKWVDTANLASTWEQLSQAYEYGVDRLWVVNVGDLKGEELPLQFFLNYAWDPSRLAADRIGEWVRGFAAENFGDAHATAIGEVLHRYGVLQARRKPELLNRRISLDSTGEVVYDDEGNPFSLWHYGEMAGVVAEWAALAERVDAIDAALPSAWRDAYFELVGYQVRATANLYALREAQFTNIWYAAQGRAATNELADAAEARFAHDQALARHYNEVVAGGKWRGFQLQPHIGYGDEARYGPDAGWQQPQRPDHTALPDAIFPPLRRIDLPAAAELGVDPAVLPSFSPYQSQPPQYLEVFNRGTTPFEYAIDSPAPWLIVTPDHGTVTTQLRATVSVDWAGAPQGTTEVPITVTGAGRTVEVRAVVDNPSLKPDELRGFVEANGYVSMEASNYSRAVNGDGITWMSIRDLGRTGDGVKAFPATAASRVPGGDGPHLAYTMTLFTIGPVTVWAYLSPRNNVLHGDGIRYAISLDDGPIQVVNTITETGIDPALLNRRWQRVTSDNVNLTSTTHVVHAPGVHTLRFWFVDPTVVVQKLVVDTGGLRPSYLGPPESLRLPG